MALQTHNDSFVVKAVTLSSVLELCTDCAKLCWERTERVVENRSRAPKGWESVFKSVAEERRQEDYDVCEQKCQLVPRSCPDAAALKKFEALSLKQLRQRKYPEGVPTIQEVSRCEHAAEDFSALLFTLAHKPSKVSFEKANAESAGTEAGRDTNDPNAPTEVHKKVLQGAAGTSVDDAIMRRWSKARKDREQMEEQGLLRTQEASMELKNQLKQGEKTNGGTGSGTVPSWK